jgi:hypothetical protein
MPCLYFFTSGKRPNTQRIGGRVARLQFFCNVIRFGYAEVYNYVLIFTSNGTDKITKGILDTFFVTVLSR